MPGKGHAYQITAEWQALVERKREEKGIGHNDLARKAGMSPSSLTGVLKPGAIQTTKMPAINKVLGIDPPLDKPSSVAQEIASLVQQIRDPIEQGRWAERIRQAVEQQDKRRK